MAVWLMAWLSVWSPCFQSVSSRPPPAGRGCTPHPPLSHTAEMAFPGPVSEHTATFTSSLASRTRKGTSVPFSHS